MIMNKPKSAFAGTVRRVVRICVGWRRLHPFGFCPACNSDAPEKYDCKVCCDWSGYRPPKGLRRLWWQRFIHANNMLTVSGGPAVICKWASECRQAAQCSHGVPHDADSHCEDACVCYDIQPSRRAWCVLHQPKAESGER